MVVEEKKWSVFLSEYCHVLIVYCMEWNQLKLMMKQVGYKPEVKR